MTVKALRFGLAARLGKYPRIYFPLMAIFGVRRERLVARDTEIVIEGFPRSANSFAKFAFEDAQRRPVKIAHHTHSPAQVLRAVAYGLPCLVLIRKPDDAIRSLLLHSPHVAPQQAIYAYHSFYSTLLPIRERFVVAPFPAVTTRFGDLISLINTKYGTNFSSYRGALRDQTRVFDQVRQRAMHVTRGDEAKNPIPDCGRRGRSEALDLTFWRSDLRKAQKIHDAFIEGIPGAAGSASRSQSGG